MRGFIDFCQNFAHRNRPDFGGQFDRMLQSWSNADSWGATQIEFENSTEDLLAFLGQIADEIFVPMLGVGAGRFIGNGSLNLQSGSQRRLEVDRASN